MYNFKVGDKVIIYKPTRKASDSELNWASPGMDEFDAQEGIISYIDETDDTCQIKRSGFWFDLRWLERVDKEVRDFGSDISLEDFFV